MQPPNLFQHILAPQKAIKKHSQMFHKCIHMHTYAYQARVHDSELYSDLYR